MGPDGAMVLWRCSYPAWLIFIDSFHCVPKGLFCLLLSCLREKRSEGRTIIAFSYCMQAYATHLHFPRSTYLNVYTT